MKKFELEDRLRMARVPERPDEYWEDFPTSVTRRLQTPRPERVVQQRAWPRLAWSLGIACVCLMAGFAVGQWRSQKPADPFAALRDEKMLREIFTMFPNRVRAIEQDEHGMRLVLSDNADIPASTPLWIQVCDGKICRAVVTFSGQELQIAKEKVEVLVDAQGKVMLVGNQFVWSSDEPNRAAEHLRIQARTLSYTM